MTEFAYAESERMVCFDGVVVVRLRPVNKPLNKEPCAGVCLHIAERLTGVKPMTIMTFCMGRRCARRENAGSWEMALGGPLCRHA